jgi:hypothetical protein
MTTPRRATKGTKDAGTGLGKLTMERVLPLQEGFQAAFWTEEGEADYQPVAAIALLRDGAAGLIPASLVARGGRWSLAEADDHFLGIGCGIEDVDAYGEEAEKHAPDYEGDDDEPENE